MSEETARITNKYFEQYDLTLEGMSNALKVGTASPSHEIVRLWKRGDHEPSFQIVHQVYLHADGWPTAWAREILLATYPEMVAFSCKLAASLDCLQVDLQQ